MQRILIFLLWFAVILQVQAQPPLTLSHAKDSPRRIAGEYDIRFLFDLDVQPVEEMASLVVTIKRGEQVEEVANFPLVKKGNDLYLNNDQLIQNGRVRYYTALGKSFIGAGDEFVIYVVDKAGNRSNTLVYPMNP